MRSQIFRSFVSITFGLIALVGSARGASAATVTFAPGDYDNTFNTATTNNQKTGLFRDVFWWRINNGVPASTTADYINSGPNLVTDTGSPDHAFPGGNDTALNFTGPSISGGQTYLTVYDTTVADGTATRNLFDASVPGGLTLSVDVLFGDNSHTSSGGIATLFMEGNDGLALMLHQGGGNNADHLRVDLFWTANNDGTFLLLDSATAMNPDGGGGGLPILGDTVPGDAPVNNTGIGDHWYRLVLNLSVTGDSFTVKGWVYEHSNPEDPNSAPLLAHLCPDLSPGCVQTVTFTGSLSNPGTDGGAGFFLTNPGEIGLIAQGHGSIGDGGCPPTSFPNNTGCNDNIGVSFTNFTIPNGVVPEPGTLLLLGAGLLVAASRLYRRS